MLEPIKSAKKILYFLTILSFFSCTKDEVKQADYHDLNAQLTRAEMREAMIKDHKKIAKERGEKPKNIAPIPSISKMVVTPPPPVIGGEKTISFSVSDQVPLKDVLIELARVAKIDIDIDPKISGGIILNAKNRPLKEIIDRIANLGNLRYSYKNGVLYFESDTPYLKNYFVDYLTGSTLWTDVESNITSMISSNQNSNSSSSSSSLLEDSGSSPEEQTASVTSNKSAGIISLFANNKQHREVSKYLADVERAASSQVLIEAKLVEVNLSEAYKTGINWSSLGSNPSLDFVGGAASKSTDPTKSFNSLFGAATNIFGSGNLSAIFSALEQFGTTRTISSPRIHAINNQKATLNFGDKLVYFKIDNNQNVTTTSGATPVTSATITSTKQEENIGVKIEITPSINIETRDITLNIKPTLSSKGGEVKDPASGAIANLVPVVQTRELSTIAKIQSGNVIVIGGLMKEGSTNQNEGIPLLGRVPILGWFFRSTSKTSEVVETVIFVKATIVGSGDRVSKYERDFNEKFNSSKRQFIE